MIKQIYEIPTPKDNEDLPRRLIIAVSKKKSLLVDQKHNKNKRFWNLQAKQAL